MTAQTRLEGPDGVGNCYFAAPWLELNFIEHGASPVLNVPPDAVSQGA